MKIITCFKLMPEERGIAVTPGYAPSSDDVDVKIGQFDLNAIEAASQLATDDNEIAALTVSGSLLQNSKVHKDVLSREPYSLYMVQGTQLGHALLLDTAKALAAIVERIGFDLLIFGEGSGGPYTQQVGLLAGELLQFPVVNAVGTTQCQGNTLVIKRAFEDDARVTEFPVPAVLCVTPDINMPCIPSIKAILDADKKPVNQWQAGDIGWSQSAPFTELTDIHVPPRTKRKHIILDNDPPEAIAELVEHLRRAPN